MYPHSINLYRLKLELSTSLPPTLQRGSMAPLVHHFSPVTLYPPLLLLLLLLLAPPCPPMRVIAAVMFVASLLATSFSVMAKQERMWPRSRGSSQVCC